jgi:hypothetical protein
MKDDAVMSRIAWITLLLHVPSAKVDTGFARKCGSRQRVRIYFHLTYTLK